MTEAQHWYHICNAMHDMVIVAAGDTLQIRYTNQATGNVLGYSQVALEAMTLHDLFPKPYHATLNKTLELIQSGSPVCRREILHSRQKTAIAVETQYSLCHDPEHEVPCIVCVIRDVRHEPTLEQELSQLNQLNQKIIEAAPIGIFSFNRQGRVTLLNRQQMRINQIPDEVSIEDFIGASILEENTTIVRNNLLDPLRNVLNGVSFDLTREAYLTRTGQYVSIRARGVPLHDPVGDVIGGLVLVEDISEHITTQKELEHSEARYRTLINTLPDLLLRFSRTGVILDYEAANFELYAPPEEFLNNHVSNVLPAPVANLITDHLQRVVATDTMQSIEYELFTDGKLRAYEARMLPINSDEILSVVRDITDKRDFQRRLEDSKHRFQSLAVALPDLIFHLDSEGRYLDFHVPKGMGFFEPQREDLLGKKIADAIPIEASTAAMPYFYEALETGEVTIVEYHIVEPGGLRYYECRFSPIAGQEIIAVVRDITERKNREGLLQIVANAANTLLATPSISMQTMDAVLALTGSAIKADVAYLIELTAQDPPQRPLISIYSLWSPAETQESLNPSTVQMRSWPDSIGGWYDRLQQGQTISGAASDFSEEVSIFKSMDIQSLLAVPVFADHVLWGILAFAARNASRPWVEEEVNASRTLAASIGGVLQREASEKKVRKERNLANTLRQMSTVITSTLKMNEMFERLLGEIRPIVEYDAANVMLLERGQARVIWHTGYEKYEFATDDLVSLRITPEDSPLMQHIIDTGKPIICRDVRAEPGWIIFPRFAWIKSWIAIPINVHDKVQGYISLDSSEIGMYDLQELEPVIESIARLAAIAFENARLYEQIQRQHEELTTLYKASKSVLSDLRFDEMLLRLAEEMASIGKVTSVLICNYNANEQHGIVETAYRTPNAPCAVALATPGETITVNSPRLQNAFTTGESLILHEDEFESDFPDERATSQAHTLIVVPLHANEKTVGFVLLRHCEEGERFQIERLPICEALASQVAIALEQARLFKHSEESERVKTRVIDMAAHDLSTPLTNIKHALLELTHNSHLATFQDTVTAIRQETDNMEYMIRNLLSLKRIEERVRTAEPVVWSEVFKNSVAIHQTKLTTKHQSLTVECPPDLPCINGDAIEITHAVANLIHNAIKYSPEGGAITLRGYRRTYGGMPCVAIEVQDTGTGIQAEFRNDLFTPFYRGQHEGSTQIPGVGLGLSMVKAAIEAHNGRVYFDSIPQEGSLFGFWLPV